MSCQCAACKIEMETTPGNIQGDNISLPEGWFLLFFEHDDYILCDVCGHPRQFKGGLSAYLADCLSLPDGARCMNLADSERFAAVTGRNRPKKAKRTKRQI